MSEDRPGGVEQEITAAVFAARWIMAPMYLAMVISLAFLTFIFCREVLQYIPSLIRITPSEAVVMVLSLSELALAINLMLIVLVASYHEFIVDLSPKKNSTTWAAHLDFAGLKAKLGAALVAIMGIHLLKQFLAVASGEASFRGAELYWFVAVYMSLVASWVVFSALSHFTGRKGSAK